jgi:hypothetical protein
MSLVSLSAAVGRQRQERYAPQEWESITVTRYARSLAVGPRFIGVATEGGLLFYDRLIDRWEAPMTRADGLPESSVLAVTLREDGRFEVSTRSDVGIVDPLAMRYMPEPFGVLRPPTITYPADRSRALPGSQQRSWPAFGMTPPGCGSLPGAWGRAALIFGR